MAGGKPNETDSLLNDLVPTQTAPNQGRQVAKAEIKNGLPKPIPGAFIFIMRGEAYTASGDDRDIKSFRDVQCVVPAEAIQRAMSYIKTLILPKLLAKMITSFVSVRTHHIQKVIAPDERSSLMLPLDLMDRDRLINYIRHHSLKVNPNFYSRAVDLKKAILDCEENEEAYLKTESTRKVETDLLARLDQLNGTEETE